MNPDIACIPNGVTTVVDCGSSGVSNFRAVVRILRDFEIRWRLVLHVSAGGCALPYLPRRREYCT